MDSTMSSVPEGDETEVKWGRMPTFKSGGGVQGRGDGLNADDNRKALKVLSRIGVVKRRESEGDEKGVYSSAKYWQLTVQNKRKHKQLEALVSDPGARSDEQVRVIEQVCEGIHVLDELESTARREILRTIGYSYHPHDGEVVYHAGSQMNALYIILSGAVSVVSEGDEGGRREVQVGMHYSGETFGEVTLIFPGTVQPTGIRTVGDCEFLKIEKADYDRILRPLMDRKYSARVTLLRGLPVFGDLSERQLQTIAYQMSTRTVQPLGVIARQGEDADSLFIIEKGEARVLQAMEVEGAAGGASSAPSSARGATPRGMTPRGMTPRGMTPRGMTPRGMTPRAGSAHNSMEGEGEYGGGATPRRKGERIPMFGSAPTPRASGAKKVPSPPASKEFTAQPPSAPISGHSTLSDHSAHDDAMAAAHRAAVQLHEEMAGSGGGSSPSRLVRLRMKSKVTAESVNRRRSVSEHEAGTPLSASSAGSDPFAMEDFGELTKLPAIKTQSQSTRALRRGSSDDLPDGTTPLSKHSGSQTARSSRTLRGGSLDSPGGKRLVEVATFQSGEFFGHAEVVTGSKYKRTLVASTQCAVLVLSRYELQRRLDQGMRDELKLLSLRVSDSGLRHTHTDRASVDEVAHIKRDLVLSQKWDKYKKNLVGSILGDKAEKRAATAAAAASSGGGAKKTPRGGSRFR